MSSGKRIRHGDVLGPPTPAAGDRHRLSHGAVLHPRGAVVESPPPSQEATVDERPPRRLKSIRRARQRRRMIWATIGTFFSLAASVAIEILF